MKKFTKALAAIMLTVAVVCAAGCTKDNLSKPTTEGIYLGVIGFNNKLYPKNIGLLDNSTLSSYYSFIDDLSMADNTKLYYADYTALQQLKSYGEPPKLTNVALVTFTDGLDNASLASSSNPENYANTDDYIASINRKIKSEKVHGLNVSAYSIGLKGNDVVDVERFRNDLKLLASNEDNVFEVASMNEALERFSEIASSLHSVTTTASLSVLVPPGYDDGRIIRFTFDNISVNQVNNSTRYIECTYKRPGTGIRLDNITYYGFEEGASSLYSNEMDENESYRFVFENLVKSNGENISDADTTYLKLYKKISTSPGWEPETEFKPSASSYVDEERSSALIMLVLDCTTSLGSEFSTLKKGAKRFIETLVSSNGGGSNNGGGNGGGNNQTFTINVSANPNNAGTVTGNGTYQQGQSCTVKATANSGYTFNKWTENGSQVSTNANYTFTMMGNRNLVANFTYNGGGGSSHAYVDLNLPSGLLWATCNIGADMPEGYGDYFAWGETQPKGHYDWNTYKYSNGDWDKLTKYCNKSGYGYNGYTDNLTVLQSSDDAAKVNWGNGWRMPTKAEWNELYNNTTVTWTTQNGVNGGRFTANNGNSIFLPAAGNSDFGSGDFAYYWSSSLCTEGPSCAWLLYFYSDICYEEKYQRIYGYSIRAVRSSK